MGLKTILVCLTTKEHAATLMKVAVPLARKHDAHLVGLHTIEALMVYPGIAMHVPGPAFPKFNESQKEEAAAIEEIFCKHTANEGFQSEWRLVRAESTSATDRMVECARAADLVIMAQEDRDADRFDQRQAQVDVIRNSGRPIIVVPLNYDGPAIGKTIVVGWSDTREAARATHDLLTVADEKASVKILRVGGPKKDELRDSNAIDLANMCARHGLDAEIVHRNPEKGDIAETLGHFAFEAGADLIATGAFGHSKAYDFVLGAVTYALLKDAKLPVLFSK